MTQEADIVSTLIRQHGIKQIAFVVRDLEASVQAYWELLNVGPWVSYTLHPEDLKDMSYKGEPGGFSFRHAMASKDGINYELIEPMGGPSIFADHLAEHGEGLHHVGIYVPDITQAASELEASGFRCVQRARGFGLDGDGAFAFFETDRPLATILEVIEVPKVRRQPTVVFPAQTA